MFQLAKKLGAVSVVFTLITKAGKKAYIIASAPTFLLERVPYIYYLIWFKNN